MVALRYILTLLQCTAPSLWTEKSKEKNPTDPIMIVVRFSNRCELLTLEIHFLESV